MGAVGRISNAPFGTCGFHCRSRDNRVWVGVKLDIRWIGRRFAHSAPRWRRSYCPHRVALGQGTFTALQADSKGGVTLLAGILLVIPGFISDVVALLLLIGPLRRGIGALFASTASKGQADGVVDLAPEQWRRIPNPSLPKQRKEEHEQ
jgi:hypothetical protein